MGLVLLGLVFCYGVFLAGRTAGQHVRANYQQSKATSVKAAGSSPTRQKAALRQHRAAWWTREITRGFPVTRTGLHTGWMGHQTAAAQQRAQREEARTNNIEAQASIASGLREHRKRQEEAVRRIEAARQDPPEPDKQPPLRVVPAPANGAGNTTTKGTTQMAPQAGTDGTYTDVHGGAAEHASAAEEARADYQQQLIAAQARLEGMEAADVDAQTLAEQSDLVERLRAVVAAIDAVSDQAPAVATGVEKRHGGIKEAADDSPAPMAERVFYQE